MRYRALATDYDGTLAHDGVVDAATLLALERLKAAQRRVLLVTGRQLDELRAVFPGYPVCDLIVAENGAVLFDPAGGTERVLAAPPPADLVARLRRASVPFSVGRTVVATSEPHEHEMLAAIRDLGLEWHVIFNKGSVMALPSSVNKATGLEVALNQSGLEPSQVVAIGDAENDHSFLRMCGCAVAVANSIESLKRDADWVTAGARGAGVVEVIDAMLSSDLEQEPRGAQPGQRRRP